MRATLSFSIPEEKEDFETAQNGWKYKAILEEVWDKVFRPYHKHGYGEEIDNLLDTDTGKKIFEELEKRYHEARTSYDD